MATGGSPEDLCIASAIRQGQLKIERTWLLASPS
jgi:hypothetical protein